MGLAGFFGLGEFWGVQVMYSWVCWVGEWVWWALWGDWREDFFAGTWIFWGRIFGGGFCICQGMIVCWWVLGQMVGNVRQWFHKVREGGTERVKESLGLSGVQAVLGGGLGAGWVN